MEEVKREKRTGGCPSTVSNRPDCPCPRDCPHHGRCCECVAAHWFSLVEPVWCMRGK